MKRTLALLLAIILAIPAVALASAGHTVAGIPWDTPFEEAAAVATKKLGIPFTEDAKKGIVTASRANPISMGGAVARDLYIIYQGKGADRILSDIVATFPAPEFGFYNGSDGVSRFVIEDANNTMGKSYQHLIATYGEPTDLLTTVTENGKDYTIYQTEKAPVLDTLRTAVKIPNHRKFTVEFSAYFDNVMYYVRLASDGKKLTSAHIIYFGSTILNPIIPLDFSHLPTLTVTPKELPIQ